MRRRDFITLIGSTVAAWPRAARAQQPERMRRIGALMSFGANDPEAQSRVAAFENGLRQLGWVRGHNLRIEYRWADNSDVLRTYATELVGMAPDLILVNSTPAIAALHEQRQAVPIVFTQVTDPVGEGLVLNLAHPGGHVTGFTSFEFSIGTKWLEMLKEVAPRVMRVALIFNPETAPFAELFWRPVEAAAPSFAIVAISAGAPTFADLERMVEIFAREPNGSLMVLPDVSTLNYREALIETCCTPPPARRFTRFEFLLQTVVCCHMAPMLTKFFGAWPLTSIVSSKVLIRESFRFSRRTSTSW